MHEYGSLILLRCFIYIYEVKCEDTSEIRFRAVKHFYKLVSYQPLAYCSNTAELCRRRKFSASWTHWIHTSQAQINSAWVPGPVQCQIPVVCTLPLICSHMVPSMSSTNPFPQTCVIQFTHVQHVSNVLDMLELSHILSLFIYAKQLLSESNRSWQQPYPGRGEARAEGMSCERQVGGL